MKNPFKKKSIVSTIVNVGVGGAANAAVDYAVNEFMPNLSDTMVNTAKVLGGAIIGSMVSSPVARAASDGIAVVGASKLVESAIDGTLFASVDPTTGLPKGTVGAMKRTMGNPTYIRRTKKVSGLEGAFDK